eukprot:6871825-Alexandrium_andersonii.AAC.1
MMWVFRPMKHRQSACGRDVPGGGQPPSTEALQTPVGQPPGGRRTMDYGRRSLAQSMAPIRR